VVGNPKKMCLYKYLAIYITPYHPALNTYESVALPTELGWLNVD